MAANDGMQTMQSKKLAKPKPGPATQRFLDIAEIRDGVVILKDGTMRSVIMVSSINFALKSQDEQQAMIQSYMQFLNGLEYPIQIVIQSRKMNIDGYVQALNQQEGEIENELLKSQIRDYRSFITDLVELGEIMQKRFYVVVPFDPVTDRKRNFFARLGTALSPASVIRLTNKQFKERKEDLDQRVNIIMGGLVGMGLAAARLDTEGLIELYYSAYNPDVYDSQKIQSIKDIRVEEGF